MSAFALLLCAASAFAELRAIGPALALDVPPGVKVERGEAGDDYLLYSFWKDGNWLFSIQIGSKALYPKQLIGVVEKDASGLGLRGRERRLGASREVLLNLVDGGWPAQAHAFYFEQSAKRARLADRMIKSIHRPLRGEAVTAR